MDVLDIDTRIDFKVFLKTLTKQEQTLTCLKVFEGMPYKEIAKDMGMNRKDVSNIIKGVAKKWYKKMNLL